MKRRPSDPLAEAPGAVSSPPDSLAEICGELGVPFRSNGYRYWLSGC